MHDVGYFKINEIWSRPRIWQRDLQREYTLDSSKLITVEDYVNAAFNLVPEAYRVIVVMDDDNFPNCDDFTTVILFDNITPSSKVFNAFRYRMPEHRLLFVGRCDMKSCSFMDKIN